MTVHEMRLIYKDFTRKEAEMSKAKRQPKIGEIWQHKRHLIEGTITDTTHAGNWIVLRLDDELPSAMVWRSSPR